MYPTLVEFGETGIHTWGLMVTLAFLVAVVRVQRRVPRVGVNPDQLVPMYVLLIAAALAGARLLHFVFAEPGVFFSEPTAFFDPSRGGYAFYGGVIGGGLAGALYCRARGLPVWKVADVCATAIPLGLAVGRVGCFFAGCCHGGPVDVAVDSVLLTLKGGQVVALDGAPWVGLVYFPGVGVGDTHNIALYPSQPWAVLGGLSLAAVLSVMWRRHRRFDGQIAASLFVLYAGLRSLLEAYRGDTVRGLYSLGPLTLSTSQIVSLGMVAAAVAVVALKWRGGVAPETPWVPPTDDELDAALLADDERHRPR